MNAMAQPKRNDHFTFRQVNDLAVITLGDSFVGISRDTDSTNSFLALLAKIENERDITSMLLVNAPNSLTQQSFEWFLHWIVEAGDDSRCCVGLGIAKADILLSRELNMLRRVTLSLLRSTKTVLTGLQGNVVAPFFGTALTCDFRFASENLTISFPHVLDGVPTGGGLGFMLPRFVGEGKAIDLLFSRRSLGASEAFDLGLVHSVIPDDDFEARCEEAASWITARSGAAVSNARRNHLLHSYDRELATYLDSENGTLCRAMEVSGKI